MIGNDVVDLAATRRESNWKRNGFLEKLFTLSEQALIKAHTDPELMVWALWSMKEAAYKIYNRQTGLRAYIPLQLQCVLTSVEPFAGVVSCNNYTYFTRTVLQDDMIHSVATLHKNDISKITEVSTALIYKGKDGLPCTYHSLLNISIPVSVSHHGRYQKNVFVG